MIKIYEIEQWQMAKIAKSGSICGGQLIAQQWCGRMRERGGGDQKVIFQ